MLSFKNNYLRVGFDSKSVTVRSGELVRRCGSRGLRAQRLRIKPLNAKDMVSISSIEWVNVASGKTRALIEAHMRQEASKQQLWIKAQEA